MIVARIMGGLGNQLFEYAAGRRLAIANNDQLKLDLSAYETSPRPYRLNMFNIVEEAASRSEVEHLTGVSSRNTIPARLLRRVSRYARRHEPSRKSPVIAERTTSFHPEVLSATEDVYLNGYWQSELYFQDVKDVIRREFTLKIPPDATNQDLGIAMGKCESVSLHVRRGDYVSNPLYNQVHGLCPLSYYRAGVELMADKNCSPHFFVFSDDVEWAKKNLEINHATTYLDHNGEENDFEDLRLMSLCKHHIIANSSFSWWGAWLSTNPGKTIIAPKTWFNDQTKDSKDIVPDSWWRI